MNDKKSYNPKSFMKSSESIWKQTQELVIENLNLVDEILNFIQDAKWDDSEADKYLNNEEAKEAYNVIGLETPKDTDEEEALCFYNEIKTIVMKDIREFRTQLIVMTRPAGDALTGYKINKSQEQLYQILNEARLYQNNMYSDERVRQYSRYFFGKLANKSREVMADKLILDFSEEKSEKEGWNNIEKKLKGNKSKKRKKNIKKAQHKENNENDQTKHKIILLQMKKWIEAKETKAEAKE